LTPTIVTIRPGVQFTPDAAAAFRRAEATVRARRKRNIDVNSTFRSRATQLKMYNDWQDYIHGRGPHPGHSKALHPDDPLAFHVTGEALDSDDWVHEDIVDALAENGFIRNRLYVPGEQHHFEYIRSRDRNYGRPSGGSSSKPKPKPKPTPTDEELEMDMLYIYDTEKDQGYAIHPVTGKKRKCSRPEWDAVRDNGLKVTNMGTKRADEAPDV